MDPLLIAARAVHFAGTISLAGIFGYVAFLAPLPAVRLRRSLRWLAWSSLAVTVLSGPLRLLFVAQSMTGDNLAQTITSGAPLLVLESTQFGHAALLRFALLIALVPCVALLGRRRLIDGVGMIFAAVALAAIAWQGHAGADIGWNGAIHLAADAGHLVAAGLWLGALLPLALHLRNPADAQTRYRLARRFSHLGIACVAVLLGSGLINSWYLVGSIPALIGTAYGQTLLLKLAVVAATLWLAAYNRWRLLPRIVSDDNDATARRLARHAASEAALGIAIIAIVAALGTMIPAAHEAIRWPFAYRLDLADLATPALRWQVAATALLAGLGLALALLGIWQRRGWAVIVGLALLLGFGWRPLELLAVAATPTSYAVSPEPFAVPSLAAGGRFYRQDCAACHGDDGEGDGPLAAELATPPLDLAAPEVTSRPEGDLFWSVTVGVGKLMPSFATRDSGQRWDVVLYLMAQRAARAASSTMIAEITANPAPLAPDFALPAPQGDAATLDDLRRRGGVLLVFATLPQSQARLDQLQQWHDALNAAGIGVVTISDAPQIRSIYALYEQRPQLEDEAPAAHIEFLIDRDGYIRARWRPGDVPDWAQLPVLKGEIAAMARVKLAPQTVFRGHVHEG